MSEYSKTFTVKRLWLILLVSLVASFATLLYFGGQIYQQVPPIPAAVQTSAGDVIYTRADIERGQNIWQSMGGYAAGFHLGTRQLSGAGLERGLAASRGRVAAVAVYNRVGMTGTGWQCLAQAGITAEAWRIPLTKTPTDGFKRLRREPRQGPGLPGSKEGVVNGEKWADAQTVYAELMGHPA